MLEKDVDVRYRSASDVLDDLDALARELEMVEDIPVMLPPARIRGGMDDPGISGSSQSRDDISGIEKSIPPGRSGLGV